MADVERFVDREVESAGGNGHTRVHDAGDANRAYLSLSAWHSAEGTDLVTDTDTHRVRCAGSTEDTTAVTMDGFTSDASFFVTIQGDDVGGDGFYDGDLVWSTSHYRITTADFNTLTIDDPNTVVDKLQVECTKNSPSSVGLRARTSTVVFKNNRISLSSLSGDGILLGGGVSAVSGLIQSNIVFGGGGSGIRVEASGASPQTFHVINNTVFAFSIGIKNGVDDSNLTYNFYNNTLFNNTNDLVLTEVSATINHDWNAGEDAPPTDETNGFAIGTLTDAMTDPSNATIKSRNVQVKDSDSILFKASDRTNADDSNVPSVDIVANTRNTDAGTSTSIGAWANISEVAAGVTIVVPLDALDEAAQVPIVGSGAAVVVPLDAASISDFIPTVTLVGGVAVIVPVNALNEAPRIPRIGTSAVVLVPLNAIDEADQVPVVGSGAIVVAPLNALGVADQVPVVGTSVLVDAPLDAIDEAAQVPIVGSGASLVAPLDVVNIADQVPVVVAGGILVVTPLDPISINDPVPVVGAGASALVPLDTFSVAGQVPRVGTGALVIVPLDGINEAPLVPALVAAGAAADVPVDAVLMTDVAPFIAAGAVVIVAPLDTVSVAGQVPSIFTGVTVISPLDVLSITNPLPGISTGAVVAIPVDAVAAAEFAPVVGIGAVVLAPLDALVEAGLVPAVGTGATIQAALNALVITEPLPGIATGLLVTVPLDTITLTALIPTLAVGALVPPPADRTITIGAPVRVGLKITD